MLTTLSNWASSHTEILHKLCKSYQKKGNLIQPASIFYTDIFVISVTSCNSEHLFGIAVGFFPPLHNVHMVYMVYKNALYMIQGDNRTPMYLVSD